MQKIKINEDDVYAHEILSGQNIEHVEGLVKSILEKACSPQMLKLFEVEHCINNKRIRIKYESHTLFDLVFLNHRSSLVFDKWMVYVREVLTEGVVDNEVNDYLVFKDALIDYVNQVMFSYVYDYVHELSGEDPEFDDSDPTDNLSHSQVLH